MKKTNMLPLRGLLCVVFAGIMLMASCSHEGPRAADVAARAAKIYYDTLFAGGYGQWVDAQYRPDSIPQGYREQLVANARMFVAEQQAAHQGVSEVQIAHATADTANHVADVFLTFVFADSTREEVLVPMVESAGVWYLR